MSGAPATAADSNQARASDPEASAWVSANAGTGKTKVLVDRVLRLLLAGAMPESILGLTYTKTAAAEMQNRLLETLSGWAVADEAALDDALQTLLGRSPSGAESARARRLFACTLDAKGGLKIHTIHGFCERLLQRFPLEAAVTPNFIILDDAHERRLKTEALDQVLIRGARTPDSALGNALSRAVLLTGEDRFRDVVRQTVAKRGLLSAIRGLYDDAGDWGGRECAALKRLFGLNPTAEQEAIEAEIASTWPDELLDSAIAFLDEQAQAKTDKELLGRLKEVRDAAWPVRIAALLELVYTGSGSVRKMLYTKAIKEAAPDLCVALDEAKGAFAEADLKLGAFACAEASAALLIIADAVLGVYHAAKQAEGALDYDDLIGKTLELLTRSYGAAWVLFKIDGGIDHILVDEAQDTNPEQWQIIQALAEEFFAGAGATEGMRTLFAVGDEKQSIYSFQGAEPACFGAFGRRFAAWARGAELTWHAVPLTLSFRSTEPVLQAVDAVFAQEAAANGLTAEEKAIIHHEPFRKGQAGLVELWEVETTEKGPTAPAFEPWNEEAGGHAAADALAMRIAGTIRGWLDEGEVLASAGRTVRAGDILILVQKRDPLVAPLIRALKRLKVPVAGADRMRLLDQLAVQDVLALADVLLMPEDDLALAVTLKSPFFGLDDDALFDLAYDRPGSLWQALRDKATDPRFAEAATQIETWLGRADFLPPYEFLQEVLGADGQTMRKRLLTRLGPEAADAIDEMMELALSYDGEAAPSLQGFVQQLRDGAVEIKRDMEQERDEVRIMTVHGAKGLQAPIVFLPDTCRNAARAPEIVEAVRPGSPPDTPGHVIWTSGGKGIDAVDGAKATHKAAAEKESHRLLYVAMTRAEDRLYIAGWNRKPEVDEISWYGLMKSGLAGLLHEASDGTGRTVYRLTNSGTVVKDGAKVPEAAQTAAPVLPDFATRPPALARAPAALSPSRLPLSTDEEADFAPAPLGPARLAAEDRFLRGRLIHGLLQYLPDVAPESRAKAAARFVAAKGANLAEPQRDAIVAEALAVVNDSAFAPVFAPGSLAEVPVAARISGPDQASNLTGQIDRLAIVGDSLFILDYKTNRPPPMRVEDVAPTYLAQLAAYRCAVLALFPKKAVRTALLWTDGPRLMEVPEALLEPFARKILHGGQS